MLSVRAATRDDLRGIRSVDQAVVGDHHGEDVPAPVIEAGRVLVSEEDGVILAYLRWEWFWDTIPLCMTARVKPDAQRRGIGRGLYEVAEELFWGLGAAFWLSSTEETNERSLLFHESLGFRPIGTLRELGQDVGEVFLRKDLR